MPDYRAYMVSLDGRVVGTPFVITCDDDKQAIEKARALVDDRDLELWTGAGRRFVTTIKSNQAR